MFDHSNNDKSGLSMNPDMGGMGLGASDIAIPKVGSMFGGKGSGSLLSELNSSNDDEAATKIDTPAETEKTEAEPVNTPAAKVLEAPSIIASLTEDEATEDEEKAEEKAEKSKGSIALLKDLVENEGFELFEDYDEKVPLEEYLAGLTDKDRSTLVKSNLKAIRENQKSELQDEVFAELPGSLQYIAAAVKQGATEEDLADLYAAVLQVEETRALSIDDEYDQEEIVRQYLYASGFGAGKQARVESQLAEWKADGKMEKKAQEFKPDLDLMQEEQVKYRLKQKEQYKQQQEQMQHFYTQNVFNELKKGEIGGLKLNKKEQNEAYKRLTTVYASPLSGKPVNSIGARLEAIQFSDKPDYALLIEAEWLLNDRDGYRNALKQLGKNEEALDTEKKLKSAQQTSAKAEAEEKPVNPIKKKGLVKPNNIFK